MKKIIDHKFIYFAGSFEVFKPEGEKPESFENHADAGDAERAEPAPDKPVQPPAALKPKTETAEALKKKEGEPEKPKTHEEKGGNVIVRAYKWLKKLVLGKAETSSSKTDTAQEVEQEVEQNKKQAKDTVEKHKLTAPEAKEKEKNA